MHNGGAVSGPEHPSWKDGRHSLRMQQAGLATRFQTARQDPKLTELRDELALLDVRMGLLVDGLNGSVLAGTFQHMRTALDACQAANKAKPPDARAVTAALATLEALVTRAARDRETWAEILDVIDQRRKLVETVVRVERRPDLSVPVAQVVGAIRMVAQAVNEEISSKEEKGRVIARLLEILGGNRRVLDLTPAEESP